MIKSVIKDKIRDLFIVREDDGSYNLFGIYNISPTDKGDYVVNVYDENAAYNFYTLKHAVTWCVFDKNKKYKEVKRVHELDNLLVSLDAEIANHKRLLTKTEAENKYIYLAKLNEERLKRRKLQDEINQFAALSKYMQTKKFTENKEL